MRGGGGGLKLKKSEKANMRKEKSLAEGLACKAILQASKVSQLDQFGVSGEMARDGGGGGGGNFCILSSYRPSSRR